MYFLFNIILLLGGFTCVLVTLYQFEEAQKRSDNAKPVTAFLMRLRAICYGALGLFLWGMLIFFPQTAG